VDDAAEVKRVATALHTEMMNKSKAAAGKKKPAPKKAANVKVGTNSIGDSMHGDMDSYDAQDDDFM